MTAFESFSKLQARAGALESTLALNTRHQFLSDLEFDASRNTVKGCLPTDIQTVSSGKITFILSGTSNASPVNTRDLTQSQAVRHLRRYFCKNASGLGVEDVSEVFVDEETGDVKVILSFNSSREKFHDQVPLRVTLQTIFIQYLWINPKHSTDGENSTLATVQNDPFSQQLSLPIKALLDNLVNRFVTWHLVKRYPLVFGGAWRKQMDVEAGFFRSILASLENLQQTSPNESFGTQYVDILEDLENEISGSHCDAVQSLAEALGADPDEEEPTLGRNAAFCLAMERLYQKGMRRPQFKGSIEFTSAMTDVIDDDELSHDYSLATLESTSGPDDQIISWDVAMSPFVNEDEDVDSDSNFSEDEDLLAAYLIVDDVSSPEPLPLHLTLDETGHDGIGVPSSDRSQTRAPSCDELYTTEALSLAYHPRDLFDGLDLEFEGTAFDFSDQLDLEFFDEPALPSSINNGAEPPQTLFSEDRNPQLNSTIAQASSDHEPILFREDSPTAPLSDIPKPYDPDTLEDAINDFRLVETSDGRLLPESMSFTALEVEERGDVMAYSPVIYLLDSDGDHGDENEAAYDQVLELDEGGLEVSPELAFDDENDHDSLFYF
ncbi:hypothetical protein VNI00_002691 [Paramarasmius palmivorus]|uniref:Uncharacterized protein n=1 Tax=Paramarasmius palmivorus TaxID=297713 RepID=A0AAW0DWZ7_9AGAR